MLEHTGESTQSTQKRIRKPSGRKSDPNNDATTKSSSPPSAHTLQKRAEAARKAAATRKRNALGKATSAFSSLSSASGDASPNQQAPTTSPPHAPITAELLSQTDSNIIQGYGSMAKDPVFPVESREASARPSPRPPTSNGLSSPLSGSPQLGQHYFDTQYKGAINQYQDARTSHQAGSSNRQTTGEPGILPLGTTDNLESRYDIRHFNRPISPLVLPVPQSHPGTGVFDQTQVHGSSMIQGMNYQTTGLDLDLRPTNILAPYQAALPPRSSNNHWSEPWSEQARTASPWHGTQHTDTNRSASILSSPRYHDVFQSGSSSYDLSSLSPPCPQSTGTPQQRSLSPLASGPTHTPATRNAVLRRSEPLGSHSLLDDESDFGGDEELTVAQSATGDRVPSRMPVRHLKTDATFKIIYDFLNHRIELYIVNVDAFPTTPTLRKLLNTTLLKAYLRYPQLEQKSLPDAAVRTFIHHASVFRNAMKKHAESIVPTLYGFHSAVLSNDTDAVKEAVKVARADRSNFLFGDWKEYFTRSNGMAPRSRALEHPAIFAVLRGFLETQLSAQFRNELAADFEQVNLSAIAFSATLVFHVLDTYQTGSQEQIDFSADRYMSVYSDLCDWISSWSLKETRIHDWERITSSLGAQSREILLIGDKEDEPAVIPTPITVLDTD